MPQQSIQQILLPWKSKPCSSRHDVDLQSRVGACRRMRPAPKASSKSDITGISCFSTCATSFCMVQTGTGTKLAWLGTHLQLWHLDSRMLSSTLPSSATLPSKASVSVGAKLAMGSSRSWVTGSSTGTSCVLHGDRSLQKV